MTWVLNHAREDDNVVLRQWRTTDIDGYVDLHGNQVTAQYLGGILDRQQAWGHVASVIGHWSLRGFGPYGVVVSRSQQLQGCIRIWAPEGWPRREFVVSFTAEAYATAHALHAGHRIPASMRQAFESKAVTGFVHPSTHAAPALGRQLDGTHQEGAPLFHHGPHIRASHPGFPRESSSRTLP